jgi:hypothetical protein
MSVAETITELLGSVEQLESLPEVATIVLPSGPQTGFWDDVEKKLQNLIVASGTMNPLNFRTLQDIEEYNKLITLYVTHIKTSTLSLLQNNNLRWHRVRLRFILQDKEEKIESDDLPHTTLTFDFTDGVKAPEVEGFWTHAMQRVKDVAGNIYLLLESIIKYLSESIQGGIKSLTLKAAHALTRFVRYLWQSSFGKAILRHILPVLSTVIKLLTGQEIPSDADVESEFFLEMINKLIDFIVKEIDSKVKTIFGKIESELKVLKEQASDFFEALCNFFRLMSLILFADGTENNYEFM